MAECTGQYFFKDLIYKAISSFDPASFNSGITLYEVLRIGGKSCLFLEDHLHRLQESVRLSGYQYTVLIPEIRSVIRELTHQNKFTEGLVKIVLHFMNDNNPPSVYIYFIPHAWPTSAMYRNGVHTELYNAMRSNPHVKIMLPEIRQRMAEFIKTHDIYDLLLVDEDACITEGSKTNVFFIQGSSVLTPPGDRVLQGITRGKIVQLCSQLKISLIEQSISINSLNEFDAAFLTGTSPKVLPVHLIGNQSYPATNPLMQALADSYNHLINSCIGS